MTILLRLPHRKQTHVTRIPLTLQKRNKDFRTLHELANKTVYSFNQFESYFFEYWPDINLRFFFVACVIIRNIFKFRFSQYVCLCEQVGLLLLFYLNDI